MGELQGGKGEVARLLDYGMAPERAVAGRDGDTIAGGPGVSPDGNPAAELESA